MAVVFLGDCLYYKWTGPKESSSPAGFKFTVSGSSPGSFDVGHSILCSMFSVAAVMQYVPMLLFSRWCSNVGVGGLVSVNVNVNVNVNLYSALSHSASNALGHRVLLKQMRLK